ncbi:hypothetical protein LAZ67_5001024 [Cordylochernes scorpioides]|uniref:RNA-directed DNA polymerase n=1 Tax=Cordylochernes scorpioides TaxID=51811 RepID=A0ABY6KF95_9ARAC|nr:hypothetical protein LAZ67_5001024 [Cordylochernes scorpioides]
MIKLEELFTTLPLVCPKPGNGVHRMTDQYASIVGDLATSSGGKAAQISNPPTTTVAKLKKNFITVTINGTEVLALVDSGADYSVISEDFRCRIRTPMLSSKGPIIRVANSKCVRALGKCVLRIKVNELTQPFEFLVLSQCSHCVILGWDFLKLTQAEINCEHDELYLKDAPMKEEPHPVDTFHTLKDNIIPPNSIKQITVVCSDVPGVQEVAITCSKGLTLEKEIVIPASIVSLNHGRGKVWVVNGTNYAKIIPEGMKVAELSIIDNSYVCCLDGDDDYLNQKEDKCSTQNTGDLDRLVSLMDTDLSHEDRNRLLDVLRRFIGVFELQKAGPKRTSLDVKHRIDTGDHAPIRQRPYRVSPYERGIIQTEVDKMLKSGIVKPSDSPWSSPVVLVKKKDGTWRFCVDYRRLNKITRKDVYPLPRIDDTLDSLKGASVFSTMDLKSGYWQIEVDEADREKTAFVTPDGLFEFKVMPFGLCNAPATFERIMDNLLRGLKWNICLCYLDDIIVFSKTMEEHILRLEMVLNCLSKAGLTLNLEKCHFGSRRMKVLGHLIDGDGIYPDPDKVEAVRNFPRPKDVSEVRSFLGLCSYYRRFIKSFADITGPLNELLKKGKQFSWNDRQEDSFNNLKSALTSEPVLGHFDEAAPIYVHTDASGFGIGSVLVQLRDGCEQPIAYASRTLSKSEKNYSTTEKECLAVVWSISKFRPYLFGRPFSVVTDHHSLCWLANLKDPSGRLARWALRLQEYEVAVCYKNGRKHKDADCLSRSPLPDTAEETEEDILCLAVLCDVEKEQQRDPSLTKIIANCGDPNYKRFVIINNILYKKNYDPLGRPWLLVVPRTLRLEVLRSSHDAPTAGHLGFAKTYDRIRRRFFWPGLYRSVRNYVGHCRECQRRKKIPQLPPGNLKPIAPVSIPFQKIGMDLLGRFPPTRDGNRWVIVCTDYLTKYAVTKAIPTGGAVEVAKFMVNDVVLKHGAPRELITDRGRSFQAKVVNELTKMCGMSHYFTTAYHPQTNGLTERLNKTLVDMLSMYVDVDQKNWDSVLPFITFAYNTARQETTGFSPFFLVHGREAETMLDALFPYQPDYEEDEHISHLMMDAEEARQLARLQTLKAQAIDKERYDSRHKPVYYDVGDLVWVFTPVRKVGLSEKLLKKYFGPYRITKKLSDVNYEVTTVDESRRKAKYKDVVHVLRMKPYNDPETQNDEYLETVCVSTDEFKHRDDVLPKRESLRLKGLPPEPELHQTSPIMLKSESGEETPAQVPSAYFSLQQPKCPSTFSGDGSEDAQRWLKDYKRIAQYNRWDNPMCLANAIFFLAGTARQWYENNEDVLTSWEVFQRALGETFGQQEEEIKKAEGLLKIRAQKANESSESYIQDVLYLCQLIDPRMDNETKLGHLMKGVAEDVYQILIARDVDNVEQFLSQCRKIELLKKRRITTKKFERLPNVTSMACEEDELSSLIRRIVQEEVQRAFAQPMHTTDSLEEIIREEVKKNLAPISRTTTSPMMKQPRPAPTYDQAGRTFYNSSASLPKAREWRTPDDRPVCFHCGRPGHVVRYCRERRQIFANVRTRRDARRPVTLGDYMPNADGTGGKAAQISNPPTTTVAKLKKNFITVTINGTEVLALVDSGADYSVISEDFRCRIRTPMLSSKGPIIRVANSKCVRALGKCVLRIKVNELTQPFEFLVLSQCSHCVILGWDFLKLTQAEINCEHDELYLKDAPMKEEPHPVDTFHTLKDNIIPPNSIKQITVVCSDVPGVQEVAITCSKGLTLEKEIVIPASIVSLNHGRGKVWVVNGTNYAKIIPEGMKVAELSIIDNSYVCCLDGDDDYLNQKEDKCSTQNTGDLDRLVSLMDTDLSHEDRNRLLDVLRRFIGVFELQKAGPKRTSLDVKHRIDTGDHAPIRQRPYRVSPYERGIIQTEVDKMLKSGIVKPSDSPWSSPVVLVKKKDGTWRFCVDYRRLNKITRKDVYPLPRIDDTLDSLKGASVFSTMDLKSGYWQIEVDEADREKTAFVTPDGLFEFKVMPFGLCNAPATFERIMDNLLRGLKWNICLCYLDDIIVFSKTMEEHILRLEMVLNCLSKAGLTLNLEKCHFGSRRMKVLGHLIDGDGIYPDPDKVEAVRNFPRPKDVSEVRSFLGLCSYYRRFIKSFADITGPLNELLKKGKQFSWNDRQEDSFNNLKSALTSEPVLGHFDEAAPIYVHTDASGFGIGSVLVQLRDGCEQPIAYASRTLSKSEKNYSTTEKECLAVVWSISKFRPYLFGRPFSVVTDHHSLCWLANLKDPSDVWPDGLCASKNMRECQRRKKIPQLPPGNLKPIAPVSIPFQKIGMDLLGRFPPTRDGNRWVIVCTDYLTKYAVTKAIPTGGAVEVAKFMVNDVVLKHGAPRELITDRGRSFQAKVVNELTKMCGMSHYFTTAYHPQTNGLTERLNKTLVDMLSMYVDVDQKNWDSVLPFITFAYNTARQETTGFSPFFLVHGREAETMLDALFPYQPDYEEDEHISHLMMDAEEARQLARLQTLKAQAIDKERYDSRHKPVYYDVGDLVWVFTPVRKVGLSEKLLKKYFGPYRITKKLSDVNYEVTTVDESRRKAKYKDVVHVLRMKPYNDPETQNDEYLETVCVSTDEFKHRDDVLPKRE